MQVLKGLLRTMIVNQGAMGVMLTPAFPTPRAADWLVRPRGIVSERPRRHCLAVRFSIEAEKTAVSAAEVNQAARMHLDQELDLTDEELGATPAQIVNGRVSAGGSSPQESNAWSASAAQKWRKADSGVLDETARIMGCQDGLDH
jgi:hypothetical protein